MQCDTALRFAERGWAVFPVKGKVPYESGGFKNASKVPDQIRRMSAEHPEANVAIRTGDASNLCVLDVDVKNGAQGEHSLEALEQEFGKLPETLEVHTPSGGRHLYFRMPHPGLACKIGFRPGLDLKAEGGYVVAPPSAGYVFEASHGPDDVAVADLPGWILHAVNNAPPDKRDKVLKSGGRNIGLARFCGKLRREGMPQEEIEAAALAHNAKSCQPPLDESEVLTIARSISKYAPKKGEDLCIIADGIIKAHQVIYCGGDFYVYEDGVYRRSDDQIIRQWIIDAMGTDVALRKVNEVFGFSETRAFIPVEKLNTSPLLNLRNGLFDLVTGQLAPHTPEIYSTIQLCVSWRPDAICPRWLKALGEICEGDQDKIETIQEFFGLCLTRETKYTKCLMLVGEGANGKSVILGILERLIGRDNCSAIPLEKFCDHHYLANLFGKLANISIETNAKAEVYDSTLKAVTSGDTIAADPKFKPPFDFSPFCKLIFAMNTLPRVDDKTEAFFRRLEIVRLNRVFAEEDQNKNLGRELTEELDGIFLWALAGLKRLEERGHFKTRAAIMAEIQEYRAENNNVLVFINDCCTKAPGYPYEKGKLYAAYTRFCEDGGYRPLNIRKFGKEIKKHCPWVEEDRTSEAKVWLGILPNPEPVQFAPRDAE